VAGETPQVYLIHGNDEVRVHNERARLVAQLVPTEYRAENLTEIEPPGNRPLSLRQIGADLMAELATASFFPDTRRVIVVEQLGDLFGAPSDGAESSSGAAKRKTKKEPAHGQEPVTAFCRFLRRDLAGTNGVLILTAIEEPDRRRRIRTNSPLYQTIQSIGRIIQLNQPAVIFQFLDAFSNRNLTLALRILPDLLAEDDGPASVFRMLTRQVRFLIQAKLLERSGGAKGDAEQFAAKFFPPAKGLNLMLEHSFSADKIRRAVSRWSLGELNALLPRLEQMTTVVYPSVNDVYVPDAQVALEGLVLDACGSGPQSTLKSL